MCTTLASWLCVRSSGRETHGLQAGVHAVDQVLLLDVHSSSLEHLYLSSPRWHSGQYLLLLS